MSVRHPAVRFGTFALVGAAGFAVDAGIVLAMVHGAGWHPIPTRLLSFPLALAVTWWLNRRCTWSDRRVERNGRALALYVCGQVIASVLNLATFAAAVTVSPGVERQPLTGLVVAAAVGLIVNFAWSHLVVFRTDAQIARGRRDV